MRYFYRKLMSESHSILVNYITNIGIRLVQANKLYEKVCFIGDSITYIEWYKIMTNNFPNINIVNKGINGDTSIEVLNRISDILSSNSNIYIIAIGVNDIRHNNIEEPGAITIQSYIDTMESIINKITTTGASVFVVSIWPSFTDDQYPLTTNVFGTVTETNVEIDARNEALETWCIANSITYIDATPIIRNNINTYDKEVIYISDGIHPNDFGKAIYSNAVLYGT